MGRPIPRYCYVLVSRAFWDSDTRMRQKASVFSEDGELIERLSWRAGAITDTDELRRMFADSAGVSDCLYIKATTQNPDFGFRV